MLRLRAMTQEELDARLPVLNREYAEDEVRAGRDKPETVHVRQLYESLGYEIRSIAMAKDLSR